MRQGVWTVQIIRGLESCAIVGIFEDMDDAFSYAQWYREKHKVDLDVLTHDVYKEGWFARNYLSKKNLQK